MKIIAKVKPNSQQQKIQVDSQGIWIIHLKSPPVDGKANQELISLLSKELKTPQRNIEIKSGLSGKNKIIEIYQ